MGSRTNNRGLQELRKEELRERRVRQKKKQKRIRRILFAVAQAFMVLCIFWCIRMLERMWVKEDSVKGNATASYGEAVSGETVNTGAEGVVTHTDNWDRHLLKDEELENTLRELAEEDEVIAEIFGNRSEYPEELLASLVHNAEMADFVRGYLTAEETVQGGFTEEEKAEKNPLLIQWDNRWGYVPYGSSNIGIAGCGPTCLSMVIFALTGNEEATPDALADFSMRNGHYVEGAGTAWTLMTDAAEAYGIFACELGLDEAAIKQSLDAGCPVICAMREGDFTSSGHFIVLYDYDDEGFLVNDPNSRERSAKRWSYERIQYQIRNLWSFSAQGSRVENGGEIQSNNYQLLMDIKINQ